MSGRVRKVFFLVSALGLACVFALAYSQLAPAGYVRSAYGDLVNAITVPELHITDAVTAVNFNVRGFDTLGEEFILFASVAGVILLMRRQSDEPAGRHEDHLAGRTVPPASDAVRVTALMLIVPMFLFGLYVVAHGQVSPGGGFQGGVILSTAPLLLYLCADYQQFRRVTPGRLIDTAEAFGAAAYILIGVACVIAGGRFLQNFLPPGKSGTLTSGGTVALINLAVGLEVAAGLTLALLSYLEELVEEKEQ